MTDAGESIETVASRTVYENPWMTVREDQIRRADGSLGIYGVVDKHDFAVVAAMQDGQVHMVQQYRYPVRSRQWELPQGTSHAGVVDALELAAAELREETGLVAASVVHVARLFVAYGFCSQGYDVFLATGLTQGPVDREVEEQDMVCRAFSLAEVDEMIRRGEIMDATTVAVMGLLRLKGLVAG